MGGSEPKKTIQKQKKVAPKKKEAAPKKTIWRASLELLEDPDDTAVTLSVHKPTEEAATAALAELLHQRVFSRPISTNVEENMNDYSTPIGFIESIRREYDSDELPDSMTATMVWEVLYDAVCTLKVERSE